MSELITSVNEDSMKHSASQEIPHIYGIPTFITVFTKARH